MSIGWLNNHVNKKRKKKSKKRNHDTNGMEGMGLKGIWNFRISNSQKFTVEQNRLNSRGLKNCHPVANQWTAAVAVEVALSCHNCPPLPSPPPGLVPFFLSPPPTWFHLILVHQDQLYGVYSVPITRYRHGLLHTRPKIYQGGKTTRYTSLLTRLRGLPTGLAIWLAKWSGQTYFQFN